MMKQHTSVTKALPEPQLGIAQLMGAQVVSMLSGQCVLLLLRGTSS